MSLVSQNSRRRRRRSAKATAQNSSGVEMQAPDAPGLPAASSGSDVPQDPSDPQIHQGLCAREGPGTSVLPTLGEGTVPPIAAEGSSASGQLTVTEGQNTSELSTPGEGPSTSGPPAVSEGPNAAVSVTAPEGLNTSVPPTAAEVTRASEHPTVCVGPNLSESPCSDEGLGASAQPTPGEGLIKAVPPTFSEKSGISVAPTSGEGLSTSVPPTVSEEPDIDRPSPSGGIRSTAVPPTAAVGSVINVMEEAGISVSPTSCEVLSTMVPPTASDGPDTSGEGPGTSAPLLSGEGPSTSVQSVPDKAQLTVAEKTGISVPLTDSDGPGTSVSPPSREGLSTHAPPMVSKGPGTSAVFPTNEILNTLVLPTMFKASCVTMRSASGVGKSTEGTGIFVPPTDSDGPGTSVSPPSCEGLSTHAPPVVSEGPGTSVVFPTNEILNTLVLPTMLEASCVTVRSASGVGKSTSVQPTACKTLNASVRPTPKEGPSISTLRIPRESPSTSQIPMAAEGRSTSRVPVAAVGRSTAQMPIAAEGRGRSASRVPIAAEGASTSRMPPAPENPMFPFSNCVSGGPSFCRCTLSLPRPSSKATSRVSKGAEGPMEFQVLRDSENSNCITIMGLGTAQVVLTLKPQDPMEQNVAELLQFLLVKDQSKYPIRESEMRQFIAKEYRSQFPEILRRAAAHLECIFRFELRELDPEERTYILLNRLGPVAFEGLEDNPNGPKMGLLMMILGQILLNGNQAREADIWEMLWRFGVQRERRLSIFGNPKRLLSVEFVWQRYLDYRPITDCSPVEYEFYWGPRSHLETTKMKILKFMAKIYNKTPMDWPEQYNEALEEDAIRAAADDWQAVPHFRRPFFEEVSPELLAPDSELPGYPSKYPPHSWPESRLESKSRKLVQLFLLMDSTKLPIPKKGILYYIGRECSKVFPDLLNRAARTLNHVYGTELVVLDPRNHSYTLFNRREMEDTEEIVDSPNRPGNNFLMQVLSFIFIMGNHARESAVWAFLRGLGVQNGRKHVITCRYLSQRYIDSLRVPDSDPVQYDFVWGPRARLETSKMKALRYVARIHRKDPQDWPEQYREAMEDEANRVDPGPRLVHNRR